MQNSTAASPRWRAAAAVAMIVAVIAVFAWLTHGGVAGAASTTPSGATPAATQPYGSNDSARPAADGRGPCPEDQQGSGGSGSQQPAPSQSDGSSNNNL